MTNQGFHALEALPIRNGGWLAKASPGNGVWLQSHSCRVEQIVLGSFALFAAFARLTLVRHAGDFSGAGWKKTTPSRSLGINSFSAEVGAEIRG